MHLNVIVRIGIRETADQFGSAGGFPFSSSLCSMALTTCSWASSLRWGFQSLEFHGLIPARYISSTYGQKVAWNPPKRICYVPLLVWAPLSLEWRDRRIHIRIRAFRRKWVKSVGQFWAMLVGSVEIMNECLRVNHLAAILGAKKERRKFHNLE